MQNLLNQLMNLLIKDERLISQDGKLLKNRAVELGLKLDSGLLQLLKSDGRIREHFFVEVDDVLVFDKDKFVRFVNNKEFLPDSYTAYKNKIGLSDDGGETYLSHRRGVTLVWPYKDCVLEGGQTKEDLKRDEIFWNTTLAPDDIDRLLDPKVITNWQKIDEKGVHKVAELDLRENLIIKGNNLLALHSLLPCFEGRVKLIYIDPPYNTTSDEFRYNDSFTHSTWLTFMKNRLEVAKALLQPSGAIFIQISDIGVSRLRLLLDEIFGFDNFINKITVKTRSPSGFKVVNLGLFESAEYILVYGKDKAKWKYIPQYEESGYDSNYSKLILNIDEPPSSWRFGDLKDYVASQLGYESPRKAVESIGKGAFDEALAERALDESNRVFRFTTINPDAGNDTLQAKATSKKEPKRVLVVHRDGYPDRFVLNGQEITFYQNKVREVDGELKPTTHLTNIWTDIPWEGIANEGSVTLKRGKKPEKLLHRIISMATEPGDLVLDFFLGSGTTAAVAHKMNRQYIGIEQLDYGEDDSITRLKHVVNGDKTGISKYVGWQGGGSFLSCELMKWNKSFIERINAVSSREDLIHLWEEIQDQAFLSYRVDITAFDINANDFLDLSLDNQKSFLMESLDQNALYVNLSEINDADYGVSDDDKRLNTQFYALEV